MRKKNPLPVAAGDSLTATADARERTQREMQALAKAVKAARRRAGLTQAALAQRMGTTQGNIARLESGRHAPSFRSLQALARVTGSDVRIDFPIIQPAVETQRERYTMSHATATRRNLMGGAMGLAGLLGFGKAKHVTAEEATAAAEGIDDYVWTPPQYEPQPALFTILDRNDETTIVDTVDGQIEIPANPQRVFTIHANPIAFFELGAADRLVGITVATPEDLPIAGDRTEELHAALDHVTMIPNPWELDIEEVIALEPDLVIAMAWADYPTELAQVVPTIRPAWHPGQVVRACVRDYGAILGLDDVATKVIAEHDAFMAQARETVAPVVSGKKASWIGFLNDGNPSFYTSYQVDRGGTVVNGGARELHAELDITPSSFIEMLADEGDPRHNNIVVNIEQIREVDADYMFIMDVDGSSDAFINNPVVQQTVAAQQDQIYAVSHTLLGEGLAGSRATAAHIVETLTGEPFE